MPPSTHNLEIGKKYKILKRIYGKLQYADGVYLKTISTLFGKRHLFKVAVDITNFDYSPPYKYETSQVIKVKSKDIIYE